MTNFTELSEELRLSVPSESPEESQEVPISAFTTESEEESLDFAESSEDGHFALEEVECLQTGSPSRLPRGAISLKTLAALSGKTIIVAIDARSTIKQLKAIIHARVGVPPSLQRVFFEETKLEDPHSLRDYHIRPEATLLVYLPSEYSIETIKAILADASAWGLTVEVESRSITPSKSDSASTSMEIRIKTGIKEPFTIKISSTDRIKTVKQKIQAVTRVPPSQQQLFHLKKKLKNSTSVADTGISNGSLVHMLFTGLGGMTIAIKFVFNKLEAVNQIAFKRHAPLHRRVAPGISFKTKCLNSARNCKVAGKVVIVNKGFGKFDIAEDAVKLECPVCHKRAEVSENCGFSKAKWTFEGQLMSRVDVVKDGSTENHKYYTFFKDGDNTEWRFLRVTVSPIEKRPFATK